jgi:proline iminopeptidase
VRLWYRVAGNGSATAPPVVFLHGGPGYSSHSFAAIAGPLLEPALRMVYLDQRGSGRSERPWTRDYALATLVEDVEGLRRALGVPRIALVGHSFGVTLALEYAARHPERVSRLVLVSGLWDAPRQCRLRRERMERLHPEAAARVLADPEGAAAVARSDCELEWRALQGAEREAYDAAAMFPDPARRRLQDSVDAASGLRNTGELGGALVEAGLLQYRFTAHDRLTMPALVIAGARDGAAGGEPQRLLARMLPDATFMELANGGHFPYLEEPDRFARAVIAFLGAP